MICLVKLHSRNTKKDMIEHILRTHSLIEYSMSLNIPYNSLINLSQDIFFIQR